MNRFRILALCMGTALLSIISLGCPYEGPHYPTIYGPSPTPTSTPPLTTSVAAVGFSGFNPSPVTIRVTGSVTFTNGTGYTHSVYLDDGTGSGACGANNALPNGGSVIVNFPSTGTFNYHCQYHSPCALASCASCTGMTGVVVVQ